MRNKPLIEFKNTDTIENGGVVNKKFVKDPIYLNAINRCKDG
jgi:hypothetical protein